MKLPLGLRDYFERAGVEDLFEVLFDDVAGLDAVLAKNPRNILIHTYASSHRGRQYFLDGHGVMSEYAVLQLLKLGGTYNDKHKLNLFFAGDLHANFGDFVCKIYRESFAQFLASEAFEINFIGQKMLGFNPLSCETRGELLFLAECFTRSKEVVLRSFFRGKVKTEGISICDLAHLPRIKRIVKYSDFTGIESISYQALLLYFYDWEKHNLDDFFNKYPDFFVGMESFWKIEKIKIKLTRDGKFLNFVSRFLGTKKQKLLELTQKF